jgi:hypothetical protein
LRKLFHLDFVANQRRLNQALGGCLDGSAQRYIRQRPANGRRDCRERFAALKKLVEDVIVGRMANKGVDRY